MKENKYVSKIVNLLNEDEGARIAFSNLIFGNGRKPKRRSWKKKTEQQKILECKKYYKKVCSWDGIQYTPEMLSKAYNISAKKLRDSLD